MNKKLHLSACYHLMIYCGLNERNAMTVANSNYAVDCATERGTVSSNKRAVTAYSTKELWKAVVNNKTTRDKILCFHFNSIPFHVLVKMAKDAYDSYDMYKLGIIMHCLMDKTSHSEFTRHPCKDNNINLRVKGESSIKHWLLDKVKWIWTKPIGHAEAFNNPDIFSKVWSRDGGKTWINNSETFSLNFAMVAWYVLGKHCNRDSMKENLELWTQSKVDNNVEYILDHHEWHRAAREVREFILEKGD